MKRYAESLVAIEEKIDNLEAQCAALWDENHHLITEIDIAIDILADLGQFRTRQEWSDFLTQTAEAFLKEEANE